MLAQVPRPATGLATPDNPGRLFAIGGYARQVEEIAYYLTRGWYDWAQLGHETPETVAEQGTIPKREQKYIVPGIRDEMVYIDTHTGRIVNELSPAWDDPNIDLRQTTHPWAPVKRRITVRFDGLLPENQPDFRRALDMWARALDIEFVEVNHWPQPDGGGNYRPDITADDELGGAWIHLNVSTAIDGIGQRSVNGVPVYRQTLRAINVSKARVGRARLHAYLHELGHALGLAHPGPYPQFIPDPNGIGAPTNFALAGLIGMIIKSPTEFIFDADRPDVTVMSYRRGDPTMLGDADVLSGQMVYGR